MALENNDEKIIDLDLGSIKKTKIRINGDQNNIIELNLSDMNIMKRLDTSYKSLRKLSAEVASLESSISEDDEDFTQKLADQLTELDKKMREEVDFIFNSPVSDRCVQDGTMYDPHNGEFTYEYIIESLLALYANNLTDEFKQMKVRVSKHTDKYTNKKK